jgi:polyisoprenoid-binding protein YceI
MGNERLGLRLATTVDRRSFGLEWNLPLPNGGKMLADEVTLEAELFFTKK